VLQLIFMITIMFCNVADEDPAMKVAIPLVFEKTHHRYCIFHVL
jgi:hypothetical protein